MKIISTLAVSVCALTSLSWSQDMELPAPVKSGGMPLRDALSARKTLRNFSDRMLTPQELANLLWAANGLNRPDGRRTAPTARNASEIELYVILSSGVYLYDVQKNKLKLVLKEDIRNMAGTQEFTADAPVNILYVVDYTKINWDIPMEKKRQYGAVDSGFIGQNIYLHCASEGMSNVFRGMIDAPLLHQKLKLPETKEVLYAHSIGFPETDD